MCFSGFVSVSKRSSRRR